MQGNITDWGKEVKKGLIERGWSINDLAERIGKSRTRVSGVVNGRIYSDSIAKMMARWTQKRTHTYDRVGRNPCPFFVNEGEFTNGNRTEYIHRYFV